MIWKIKKHYMKLWSIIHCLIFGLIALEYVFIVSNNNINSINRVYHMTIGMLVINIFIIGLFFVVLKLNKINKMEE